jgi:predicted permease
MAKRLRDRPFFRRPTQEDTYRTSRFLVTLTVPLGVFLLWATYPSLPKSMVVTFVLALVAVGFVTLWMWFFDPKAPSPRDEGKE